jgi:hypothetical protein
MNRTAWLDFLSLCPALKGLGEEPRQQYCYCQYSDMNDKIDMTSEPWISWSKVTSE